jgi:hypothetical protein
MLPTHYSKIATSSCAAAAPSPPDKHLAATVHCVDDEIIGWLKRREQSGRGAQISTL